MEFTAYDQFLQYLISGITKGSIYALIALGFTIIYNATEIINFAQGEFVMLGGMIAVALLAVLHVPLPVAVLLAVLAVTVIGAVFERLAINPVKNASVINLIIITIGGSILIKGATMLIWDKNPHPFPAFSGTQPLDFFGAMVDRQSLWIMAITLIAVLGLHLFYERTITGKAIRASAFNRTAAQLMGINTRRMVLFTFALSGGLGALAGVIVAPITFASYDMGMMLGLKGFCAAILGGIGSNPGAVLGGLLIGLIESLGAGYISSGYKDAIAFIIMLLVLYIKPTGLLGKPEADRS